jgi:hypothetical protein
MIYDDDVKLHYNKAVGYRKKCILYICCRKRINSTNKTIVEDVKHSKHIEIND